MADVRGIHDEESSEGQRFDELYVRERPPNLRLVESDWSRFDVHVDPMSCYTASMQRMGSLENQRVLDTSCGDGWSSIILAKRGATVFGFDISKEAMRVAHARAAANDVTSHCFFVVASFYAMPFRDAAFDAGMGQSVLHHLNFKEVAAAELARVMRPGSDTVFAEPFGNALWLERLRLMVPVASQAPDDPEEWRHQFKYADVVPFNPYFSAEVEEFQLFFATRPGLLGTALCGRDESVGPLAAAACPMAAPLRPRSSRGLSAQAGHRRPLATARLRVSQAEWHAKHRGPTLPRCPDPVW